jgi:hypothetical protein
VTGTSPTNGLYVYPDQNSRTLAQSRRRLTSAYSSACSRATGTRAALSECIASRCAGETADVAPRQRGRPRDQLAGWCARCRTRGRVPSPAHGALIYTSMSGRPYLSSWIGGVTPATLPPYSRYLDAMRRMRPSAPLCQCAIYSGQRSGP